MLRTTAGQEVRILSPWLKIAFKIWIKSLKSKGNRVIIKEKITCNKYEYTKVKQYIPFKCECLAGFKNKFH